jgi:hypothetical protein
MRKRLNRSKTKTQHSWLPFEGLESRLLMASNLRSVFNPGNIPVYNPTSTNVGDVKNGPMANAGPALIDLYREFRKFRQAGGPVASFQSDQEQLLIDKGRVAVTVRGRVGIEALTSKLRALDAEIIYRSNQYKVIEAWVPVGQLHSLASEATTASINPIARPVYHQQGNSNNQADVAEKADQVRQVYGLDGSGVAVGVLSNSVNAFGNGVAGSVATGNLPSNVQVINDLGFISGVATDEGRAMLELVHDIAPGADLMYATTGLTQLIFADNIRKLREAGADVLVDDVGFPQEPFFQNGIVDLAIKNVVDSGGVYLASVGNSGDSGFEAPTNFVTIGKNTLVDFDPGPDVDTRMRIDCTGGGVNFQWDNPYNGVVGAATTDLDITFYDPNFPTRVIATGNASNLQTGLPIEFVPLFRTGRFDVEIKVARTTRGKPLPTRFKFAGNFGLRNTEYLGTRTAGQGHNSGQYTLAVGAVDFASVPPFGLPDPNIFNEPFSTFGIKTHVFDDEGNRRDEPLVLQKPDFSGIDNGNTSFFGSDDPIGDDDVLPNFAGTSAAAPNVAAVVALIRQIAPDATQEEIANALRSTATPLNGARAGEYEEQGGFGLIDARKAVDQFIKKPTVQFMNLPSSPRVDPVQTLKFTFSQQVNGLNVEDLILSRDGGPNLLSGGNGLTTPDGGRNWLLHGLEDLTSEPGEYVATIEDAGDPIVNAVGLPLNNTDSISFTVLPPQERPIKPNDLRIKVLDESAVRLNWDDNSDNEDAFEVWRSNNSQFTQGVVKTRVPANTTTFKDDDISPQGRTLFYRVRAINNFAGGSTFSNVVSTTTFSNGEIVLDNASGSGVSIRGDWALNTAGSGVYGTTFLSDENSGKGSKSVRYTPNIEFEGDYFVYARWSKASNRATNVPYDVGGDTVTVDQRNTGGTGWVLLGKFSFDKGTGKSVTISNAGTNGVVIADSIRFLPAEGARR